MTGINALLERQKEFTHRAQVLLGANSDPTVRRIVNALTSGSAIASAVTGEYMNPDLEFDSQRATDADARQRRQGMKANHGKD